MVRLQPGQWERGFTMELRVPLDLIEVGREPRRHGFSVEVWELATEKPLAVYPLEGGFVAAGEAALEPAGDEG